MVIFGKPEIAIRACSNFVRHIISKRKFSDFAGGGNEADQTSPGGIVTGVVSKPEVPSGPITIPPTSPEERLENSVSVPGRSKPVLLIITRGLDSTVTTGEVGVTGSGGYDDDG